MDFSVVTGYVLAVLVGVSLGLVGSGGSILTVPILVYVLGIDPVIATGYSLFVVGSTAFVGGIKNALKHNVAFNIVAVFGIPSLLTAYVMRAVVLPALPKVIFSTPSFTLTKPLLLMLLFAVVMLTAAIKMIRSAAPCAQNTAGPSPVKLALSGVVTGVLAGAVGAGGGFLIIPALVFLAGMPMKKAVGTSLFIIAIQSLAGFVGDLHGNTVQWGFLLPFTLAAVCGIFIGIFASQKIEGEKLKKGFGYFVLLMGIYIIVKELIINKKP